MDFNRRSVTGIFAAPVAQHAVKRNVVPAPNTYNVLGANTGKVNNVTADAAFRSKTKREMISTAEQSRLPAPDAGTICASLPLPYLCLSPLLCLDLVVMKS
ncbi:uncharacterized protein LOC143279986 [Babylonia areolata]|uniref:uncharacterized protein LOC143279986 n=1 Tax=Babylonia areolata TaxID=304850 RepID=UPI003FD0832E